MRNFTLKHFIVFMGLTAISVLAQAQIGSSKWSFSNPKPFGFSTFSLSYADDNNALAVGNSGGIAKTSDGGGTWMYFTYVEMKDGVPYKPTLNEVQYVTSSVAYAIGTGGIMIKSIDGGINWTALTTPFAAESLEIFTVFFTDANTGYIGGAGDPITKQCTLYKTINGGVSWTAEHVFPAPSPDYYEPGLFRIRFSASGVGYFTGATGSVWKYDAGTWTDYSITETTVFPNVSQEIDTVITPHGWDEFSDTAYIGYADNVYGLQDQNYRGLAIMDDTVIVVSTQNNGGLIRINTSTPAGSYVLLNNGGAFAYDKYAPLGSPQMYSMACKDGMQIYITSGNGSLISSYDKGYTWQSTQVYPEGTLEANYGFYGLDISPAGRIGLSGAGGVIADSLTAWRRPYKNAKGSSGFFGGYSIESISFADDKNGVGVGSFGAMLRTQNGGDSWEDISNASFASSYVNYNGVSYLSPTVMYACASNGQFFKSVDKGSSFDLLFEEPSVADQRQLTSMHFTDEEHGWMTAFVGYLDTVTYETTYHSIIYRTTDGGMSWDSATTIFPTSADYVTLNDIKFFSDNKVGYAVGSAGILYKSIDGGKTWVVQTVPDDAVGKSLRSISIIDADIAFICGEQGVVMKTTNGGTDWTMCNTGLPGGYTRYGKILMNDAARGLLFGPGNIYATTDGGANWIPYYLPVRIELYAAAYVAGTPGCTDLNCKNVYVSGGGFDNGSILKFEAGVVLPAKFSNLSGMGSTDGNQLFWTAFSQEAVSYFMVERSADGVSFTSVGSKVYPAGTTAESYKWLDNNIIAGKNYYRVKVMEATGGIYYTNTIVITAKNGGQWFTQLSHGNLILNNIKVQKGYVNTKVMNAAGQTIVTKSWNQHGGAFNQSVPLPVTAKGIYYVSIENAGTVSSFKIFVN